MSSKLPGSDTDEQNLVAELSAAALDESAVRILHVAALDSGPSSMGSLLRMQHRVLGGTQRLFRAAATADLPGSIWVFTRGAQRIEAADTVAPEQRSLGASAAPRPSSTRRCGAGSPTW